MSTVSNLLASILVFGIILLGISTLIGGLCFAFGRNGQVTTRKPSKLQAKMKNSDFIAGVQNIGSVFVIVFYLLGGAKVVDWWESKTGRDQRS